MQQAIDRHGLPWHVTRLGCRVEYLFHAERARTGAQAAAAGDEALDRLIHLYALNRGILLTPFHNMALMSPATTEADVDRHTEVFDAAARGADRGLAAGTVPRAYQARASSSNGPDGSPSSAKQWSRIACWRSASCWRRYEPAGPTANVNGSQKSSKSAYLAEVVERAATDALEARRRAGARRSRRRARRRAPARPRSRVDRRAPRARTC